MHMKCPAEDHRKIAVREECISALKMYTGKVAVTMNKYETMTDEQLIRALRDGERGVMDFIMVKYKSMVRKKARAMFLLGGGE